jgi:hypothetical protein
MLEMDIPIHCINSKNKALSKKSCHYISSICRDVQPKIKLHRSTKQNVLKAVLVSITDFI